MYLCKVYKYAKENGVEVERFEIVYELISGVPQRCSFEWSRDGQAPIVWQSFARLATLPIFMDLPPLSLGWNVVRTGEGNLLWLHDFCDLYLPYCRSRADDIEPTAWRGTRLCTRVPDSPVALLLVPKARIQARMSLPASPVGGASRIIHSFDAI